MIGVAGAALGAAALSNGGNLLSTVLTNDANAAIQNSVNESNYKIAQEANALSVAEAQKNRNWQTYMSNTEVQRKMRDLEAAGINPILAANPSGASASSVGNPQIATGYQQAYKNNAAHFDFNSISSAFTAMEQIENYAKLVDSIGDEKHANSLYKNALTTKINLYNSGINAAAKAGKLAQEKLDLIKRMESKRAHEAGNGFDIANYNWLEN